MISLRPGWELRECQDYPGLCYYYNKDTKFSTWHHPPNEGKSYFLQHIIIKFKESVNTVDREGKEITRTADEAMTLAQVIHKQLLENTSKFEELAERYSDIYDKRTNSNLGWLLRANLLPEFRNKVCALQINEIMPPVKSKMGVHIFKRLG